MVTLENRVNQGFLQGIHKRFRRSVLPFTTAFSFLYGADRVEAGLKGDANNDGVVDFTDFVGFGRAFGSIPGDKNWDSRYDIDRDNIVGFSDFVALTSDFGKDFWDFLISSITDADGVFRQNNKDTEYKIKVQDEYNQAVRDASVLFTPLQNGGVVFVQKSNMLPSFDVLRSKAEKGARVADGIYTLVKRGKETRALYRSFSNEEAGILTHWEDEFRVVRSETYVKTIGLREKVLIDKEEDAVVSISTAVADIITGSDLGDQALELWDYFKDSKQTTTERWDVFRVKIENRNPSIRPERPLRLYKFVPSNVPTLTLANPKIEGNNVRLSWTIQDKGTYERGFGLETIEDPTVLKGYTPQNDLICFYKIMQGTRIIAGGFTPESFAEITLPNGSYSLEAIAQDEVENKSAVVKRNLRVPDKLFDGTIVFTAPSIVTYRVMGVLHSSGEIDTLDFKGKKGFATWSDKEQIAFSLESKTGYDVLTYDFSSKSLRKIFEGLSLGSNLFSFDNNVVVAELDTSNTPSYHSKIWGYSLSTGNFAQLTNPFYGVKDKISYSNIDRTPILRNGEIVYLRRELVNGGSASRGVTYNILMHLDSQGNERELFRTKEREWELSVYDFVDNKVIYTRKKGNSSNPFEELWAYDLRNKNQSLLHAFSFGDVDYSPPLRDVEVMNDGNILYLSGELVYQSQMGNLVKVDSNFQNPVVLIKGIHAFDWTPNSY